MANLSSTEDYGTQAQEQQHQGRVRYLLYFDNDITIIMYLNVYSLWV